jgi:carbon monoxide dehydrogenase subunit G
MRIAVATDVAAPREAVWEVVTDPERSLHVLHGVTRWEVVGDRARGLGARYRMLMHVGSAEIGGLVEVVEWREPGDVAWHAVTGIDQRGRWRLRALGPARTRVELRFAYGIPDSGVFGWIAEQVAAPTVRRNLRRSLAQLKREVEHEEQRRAAARRRAARAA